MPKARPNSRDLAYMYLIHVQGDAPRRICKQRFTGKMYISSGQYTHLLHVTCILLVAINLLWICYNMGQTTHALETLEETYHLRKPREWDIALDDV